MCALTNSAHTPQIGRTHGIHAEPITFGLKIANWFSENQRNIERFRAAPRRWLSAKFPAPWQRLASRSRNRRARLQAPWAQRRSGCFASDSARSPRTVSQRSRAHRRYARKIALEIRHLQRTEVREAEEPFSGEQRGSSPCLTSAIPSLANKSAAWRASSVQTCSPGSKRRFVARTRHLPQFRRTRHSSRFHHFGDYMLSKMTAIIGEMRVFPERMIRNLESTHGLIYSGQLLQDLVERGMPRIRLMRRCKRTPWPLGKPTRVSATAFRKTNASRSTSIEGASAHLQPAAAASLCGTIFDRVWRASGGREIRCGFSWETLTSSPA